jgi:uncharacterized protein YcbK (DUF882 family)
MGNKREIIEGLLRKYNISYNEYACKHCGKVPPGLLYTTDEGRDEISIEYDLLFSVFSQIRSGMGKPLYITSGYRCPEHERKMFYEACKKDGTDNPKGKAFISAHLFGLALDIAANNAADQTKIVELARGCHPKPRIGWQIYRAQGVYIVHIDFEPVIVPPIYEEYAEEW